MEDGNHFRCEKCNQTYPDFKHRLILSVRELYTFPLFAFDEEAENAIVMMP